jgi:hypothetical protein
VRNEYCTLFDVNYLPRALVLFRSLRETCPGFRLRAYCMDEKSYALLQRLAPVGVEPISLRQLERDDPGLAETRAGRSQVEYCWTATPSICLHALERDPSLAGITYVDADLMLFSDPAPLWDELGDGSILLVPHRFGHGHAHLEPHVGRFNVEFMTFRRDGPGLEALAWWRERCLEWCHQRYEDGKFGDQKYLDDWPERFAGVHVLEHPGGRLAPWNADEHELTESEDGPHVDGQPLVFFHFHGLSLFGGLAQLRRIGAARGHYRLEPGPPPLVWKQNYAVGPLDLQLLWQPYVHRLSEEYGRLRVIVPGFSGGFVRAPLAILAMQVGREFVPAPVRRLRRGTLST